MKKSIISKIAALFLLTVVLASCNKYEEGSKFTLLTAKMRITNTWTSTSYEVSSALGTTTSDVVVYTFDKEGSYTAVGTWLGLNFSDSGTWAFNGDKTEVILNTDGEILTWTIVKLKSKELKLSNVQTLLGSEVTTVIDFTGN